MSDFFSFLRSNRSKIGLVDSYNLGEIYTSDHKDALKNIFLDPDGLDQIYRLSRNGVIKEDIRVMGGLDRPVIHSLSLANETLVGITRDISLYLRTDDNIGEPGKHSFSSDTYSDNIIVFHGGIAANNIEYNFLDENGEVRTTTVPTSRESLFNSLKDTTGRVSLASYPSLFRVRRRSHLNELRLNESLIIPRQSVVETPTDVLRLPVYMRTSTNISPSVSTLECYSTKNSPLILPVKISTTATFSISRNPANAAAKIPFVFGYELKRSRDGELIRSEVINSAELSTVQRTINVIGTLGQNQDCKLYLYLDPSQVEEFNISGFGIKEEAGRDIGLVGFSNLKKLNISNNNLSTYPVWLKTLNEKLEYLDISNNDYWTNGIVEVFDYQDMIGTGVPGLSDLSAPAITASQVLGYSGYLDGGVKSPSYIGTFSSISDSNGRLYKDARKDSYLGNPTIDTSETEGFRTFSSLRELIVGHSVPFINADFSKLFPNLENFQAPTGGNQPRRVLGLLPKFRNSDQLITVNYENQDSLGGTINMMGDTPTWTDVINDDYVADPSDPVAKQFIGQFNVKQINAWNTRIRGGFLTGPDDVDGVSNRYHVDSQANVANAWRGWLDNLESINIGYYSNACFKVANGSSLDWRRMSYLMLNYSWRNEWWTTKVRYNSSVAASSEVSYDILTGNSWSQIHAWESGWGGKMFSIANAPSLSVLNIGRGLWEGYGDRADGFRYLFPSNFVSPSGNSRLSLLYLHYIVNAESRKYILRRNEFQNLKFLNLFYADGSKIFGKFPTIYNDGVLANRIISTIHIGNCNFRDLSAIGSSNTRRIRDIYFFSQSASLGGALSPNFASSSNNVLSIVNGDSSLPSTYPSNWRNNPSLAGRPIISATGGSVEENIVPGVSWFRDPDPEGEGERIMADNPDNVVLLSYLMVGDSIIYSGGTVGTVTQVDIGNGYIYAQGSGLSSIPTEGTNILTFRRRGQNIFGYFENHTALSNVRLNNIRAVGTIPRFTGCRNVAFLDLGNNLFSEYQRGTIGVDGLLGTSGTVNLRNLWLYNNPLTKESIRKIIKDCYDFVSSATNRNYNITISITGTYYNATTRQYRNWTRAEIFTEGTTVIVPDPTDINPNQTRTVTISDPYEVYFDQMGPGNTYPNMKINLF